MRPHAPGFQGRNRPWQHIAEGLAGAGCQSPRALRVLCFENGRFWLVINEKGNMVTARQEPRLVLISLICEGDALTLSAAYTKDLLLPVQTPPTNAVVKCR